MTNTPNLASVDVMNLLNTARNAELCRDISTLQKNLQPLWSDYDRSPEIENYEVSIQAEILRLCGFFLTFYARSKNLPNLHLRAKDLLTQAIELFEKAQLPDKVAESQIILAFSFWNTGETEEADILLQMVEAGFASNDLHPILLQLNINRLLILTWNKELTEALKLSKKLSKKMEFCSDLRLRAMFHSESGIIYRRNNRPNEAIFHFNEAIRFSAQLNNLRFVALNQNNLAMLYRQEEKFDAAHSAAEKSLKIYQELDDTGWIPHVLDTKALIYISQEKYLLALKTIDKALKHFKKGEDVSGLTGSLFTKVQILIKMDRLADAFHLFGELQTICREKIGDSAAKRFAEALKIEFKDNFYKIKNLGLWAEETEFRKTLIVNALKKSNGAKTKAAKILNFDNHQTFSNILNEQYSGLYESLGYTERAPRKDKKTKKEMPTKNKSKEVTLTRSEILHETPIKTIRRLVLKEKSFSFDFYFPEEKVETYYFDIHLMRDYFQVDYGCVVVIIPVSELKEGLFILVGDEERYIFGKLEYDRLQDYFFIVDGNDPIIVDASNIVGKPVAYCSIGVATESKVVAFAKLEY